MSTIDCIHSDRLPLYALGSIPPSEAAQLKDHLDGCGLCREELASLQAVVTALERTDVLRAPHSLWARVQERIGFQERTTFDGVERSLREPEWENVAPGIFCRILSQDDECKRVSMLVRLAPGADYPPHTHAGVEELHLLDGELWIDERKLRPGDYNRAEPGTSDRRVWSETGCTCVLITSTGDRLG